VGGAEARPGGARFGTLVHAVLADVPLAETNDTLMQRLVEAHARVLGADRSEAAAALDVVRRVLRHPLLRAAAAAEARGRCYRETPVTWRANETTLVEGVVDLAFAEEDGFVVVDFKTDRELEGAVDRYERQLQVYASAISAAMGTPARGVLIRV
jgi:ATP-dependent exoDNAse (exonuclease V) beta subunit